MKYEMRLLKRQKMRGIFNYQKKKRGIFVGSQKKNVVVNEFPIKFVEVD